MYKPLQTRNTKNPPLNRPSQYKSPGGLYLEIALTYKVKQSKTGKFPSNYKAIPIDFETQISLRSINLCIPFNCCECTVF